MDWKLIVGLVLAIVLLLINFWWFAIGQKKARLHRDWAPDCAQQARFEINGDSVTLHNRRDFTWRTTRDFDENWDTWSFDMKDLKDIWYVVDYFHKIRGMAHTMVGFEFTDNRFLMASFEVRRQKGQKFHPWTGMWNEFELILIWATERDLLGVRTNGRGNDVYLYPCDVLPEKQQALLQAMMNRTNQLAEEPEWYNTMTATCTTSITQIVNRVTPGRVPFTWRAYLPGYSPWTAWKRGILSQRGTFKETVAAAAISEKAKAAGVGEPGTHDYSINGRK